MRIDESEVRKSAETELKSLCHLKHPNIVEYIDCFQQSDTFFLVLEYCSGGDLSNRLKKQGDKKLPESKVIQWTFEICLALKVGFCMHITLLYWYFGIFTCKLSYVCN